MAQEKLAAKIFDSVVKRYDRFLKFTTFGLIDRWQNILVENTPAGENPLDIGTGTGEIVKKIHKNYPDSIPIGVDVSFNMLLRAKEKNKDHKNLFIQASAYELPFKKSTISSIFLSLVFRHLSDEKAILEFDRVLKNSGYIGILDISKPPKIIFNTIFFFANRIFRPVGERIFSREEYDYFMDSVIKSKTPEELEDLFKNHGYTKSFIKKAFFGMIVIAVFRKV
ncbi:demethylmenaquinone methyltransferase / 2-methoxy-6-polyprenyl-1,4-benzoquinol methylase [Persephonella hydrogeniphila]|uniref:Demethylmenaquinone methyltransferase / 2-methoxy-6-polyprenyl-1,4-benzoquinol methylase n=1 Tax=Persephonella hydrogeniphila TaxID=198703 RepID=A0A285N313_9AQUI|nr:class I SAM-dependent methyltransferase [Persephonella hydrogeniphila]SNZ03864.1 demethylmenaquinone methyltransferase / 2-methoxy-6-polyprenyl-1,4-benzoquinol methylase [Persephonella hydrogeniphila]